MTNQCDHGQLARSCPLCEKDHSLAVAFHVLGEKTKEIEALRAQVESLERGA